MHIRCFSFPFIFGFFILFVDSSGMDFRSMLKKKKYAKWGNDDEGLYGERLIYFLWFVKFSSMSILPLISVDRLLSDVTEAWTNGFQTKDNWSIGPDWGDLKHHDKPEEPVLKDEKPVRTNFTLCQNYTMGQDYFQALFIRGISMKTTLMFLATMSSFIQIISVVVHIKVWCLLHCTL